VVILDVQSAYIVISSASVPRRRTMQQIEIITRGPKSDGSLKFKRRQQLALAVFDNELEAPTSAHSSTN